MKRFAVVLLAFLLAGSLIACQPSAEEEQLSQLDDAIHKLERGFPAFYSLRGGVSSSSVEAATQRLTNDWNEVVSAADGLEQFDLSEASEAHRSLVDAVDVLPERVEDAHLAVIIPLFEEFADAVEEVHESGDFH